LFEWPPEINPYLITFKILPQADIAAALFISGEAKIGLLPVNMAAKIAAIDRKIQAAAVTGTGMLTLLSHDPQIECIEDLKGKTIEVAGQGATPDYVFRKILQAKGLIAGRDLSLNYNLTYPETALALASGRIQYALLPEPFTTLALNANSSLVSVADIQEEWIQAAGNSGNIAGGNFPMTLLAVNRDFANAHSNLISVILDSVKNSIEWVRENPESAGLLAEKYELGLPAEVVEKAIPGSNYIFIPILQARADLEVLLSAFYEYAPASIGGALPSDDFYYTQ
jgi:NitT/TauT family transport system substrate-binding protein